ncbi:hypothetical protein EIP86_005122 [Pleurotus ostreatoroseus]|nr:hypothetical protein EIP86_005122 [Pleurotus ostreatoroseus]
MSDDAAGLNTSKVTTTSRSLRHFQDINNSDITLRCSDKHELHVYMVILSIVSPVFHDMFTFPLPAEDHEERRVVELTESGQTMELLLRFCYPQEDPVIKELQALHRVLQPCDKYQMDTITKKVAKRLSEFSRKMPLRVFCVAYHAKLATEARQAAFDLLRGPESDLLDPRVPELHLLTIPMFAELLRYYRRCVAAATSTVSLVKPQWYYNKDWITNDHSCWFSCDNCDSETGFKQLRIRKRAVVYPRQWWVTIMNTVGEKLADSPLSPSALDHLRCNTPKEILRCSRCGPAYVRDLLPFLKEMEDAIVASIRQIELNLNV